MELQEQQPAIGRSRLQAAVMFVGVALVLVVVALNDPHVSGTLPACPFRTVTGWLCPGCGSTRMVHHLLHGELVLAATYNPVAFAFMPAFFVGVFHLFLVMARGRGLRLVSVKPWMPRVALCVLMGWGVVRNFFDSPAAN